MWITIGLLAGLSVISGLLLGYAAVRFKAEGNPIVEQVNAILPQMQCGKCGSPGCRSYAEAIIKGEVGINQCSPGGETVMLAIAHLLDREPKPLNAQDSVVATTKWLAVIDETLCIGCTKCIQACPIDAILGAPGLMHTVIAQECTGCDLCVAPCPVDCIKMVPVPPALTNWKWPYPS
jgi:electron transport complex protein RnfB